MRKLNQVILVDENDNVVGEAEKIAAHRNAQLHRAFSIFILRQHQGEVQCLLQKRHSDKYHCGGLWTNTCCSHPCPGEDILSAANRRLAEELGFTTTLTPVGSFIYKATFANGLTEYEYDHVLMGYWEAQPTNNIAYNKNEISEIEWVALEGLAKDIQINADKYTPWLKPALHVMQKSI